MPREMCTNGFGEAKGKVQELRLTKGEEGADECERQNVTELFLACYAANIAVSFVLPVFSGASRSRE